VFSLAALTREPNPEGSHTVKVILDSI